MSATPRAAAPAVMMCDRPVTRTTGTPKRSCSDLVHARIACSNETCRRPLVNDALEHGRLHPLTEPASAVRRNDRGPLLIDDVRGTRVVDDFGVAGGLAGAVIDREQESPKSSSRAP